MTISDNAVEILSNQRSNFEGRVVFEMLSGREALEQIVVESGHEADSRSGGCNL